MPIPNFRPLRAATLAFALLCGHGVQAQASAPVPIAHFFEHAAFTGAELSPNGKYLAMRFSQDNSRDRLAVYDTTTNAIKVVASFGKRDIDRFMWINNDRLVFDSRNKEVGYGEDLDGPGLYAVDRDGSKFQQLVHIHGNMVAEHLVGKNTLPWNHSLIEEPGSQNSEFVYIMHTKRAKKTGDQEDGDILYQGLLRLNTLTGRAEGVNRPGNSQTWMLDHSGEPRLTTTLDKNIESVFYLDPKTKAWRKIASFDTYLGGKGAFTPLGFSPDGTLYVISNNGQDKFALYTFDLSADKLSDKPVIAVEDFDFDGNLITSQNKLLGVRYLSDARATVWFDDKMKNVQAAVDKLLPSTVNLIDVPARPETPWVLVSTYSDRQPMQYALFNTDTGKFNSVGERHPNIKPAQMGEQEIVHFKARDGMRIPAWLTVPNASKRKNLPMVVLVHGGPWVRGAEWGWSSEAQFLASRGYAVLEPEFRGSTGYGVQHYRAGWKQWGKGIQNDIADSTRWAIAQGIADPKRICIAGASFGGYATLMGLINDPDLYQCGINAAGVTDIKLMYTGHWSMVSDISSNYTTYGMPTMVGDPVADAAQLKATSPIEQAARLKRPLLMAYGGGDERVPLYHGKLFHTAVKAHNPDVEMIVYNDEGHGWGIPKNKIDYWSRVEKFLEKHIGKP